jgi:hypothetical protein
MGTHRYVFVGPQARRLQRLIDPSITASTGAAAPRQVLDVTLSDDAALPDLDEAMAQDGFEYLEKSPPGAGPSSVLGSSYERLKTDMPAILPAAGWTKVVSVSFSSLGGTVIHVSASAAAAVLVGGGVRVTLDGGSFANQSLGGARFAVVAGAYAGVSTTMELPTTAAYTSYLVTLQAQAVGLLSSVVFNAASQPDQNHASLTVTEVLGG